MIALLGIPYLFWLAGAFIACSIALGLLMGRVIRMGEESPAFPLDRREPEPEDLDDWLAAEEPFREFKVWKRPEAEVRMDRGVAS